MIIERNFYKDKLKVQIFEKKEDMGAESASFVTENISRALQDKGYANLILGTGASQFPMLEVLLEKELDWKKINLFHLDEYIGLSDNHPASFRRFLRERVAEKVNPRNVYYLNGDAEDIDAEIQRYENLLRNNPIDVACIGIGENGHIAFNDPAVADFNDPEYVKVVEMDQACRQQQVDEGWYPSMEFVPKNAVTLTVTAIMDCKVLCCTVPDERKSTAVYNTLSGEIDTTCPASILRKHDNAVLFLDDFSANKLFN